jgi:uncharacterized protein (TIGR02246 family)
MNLKPPEGFHARFAELFNAQDLEGVVDLYEQNAVLMTNNFVAQGRDEIRETYKFLLTMRPTIQLETTSALRSGDLAMMHGKWSMDGTAPDGSAVHTQGRDAETLRLQPDGRWLLVLVCPFTPHS